MLGKDLASEELELESGTGGVEVCYNKKLDDKINGAYTRIHERRLLAVGVSGR